MAFTDFVLRKREAFNFISVQHMPLCVGWGMYTQVEGMCACVAWYHGLAVPWSLWELHRSACPKMLLVLG